MGNITLVRVEHIVKGDRVVYENKIYEVGKIEPAFQHENYFKIELYTPGEISGEPKVTISVSIFESFRFMGRDW